MVPLQHAEFFYLLRLEEAHVLAQLVVAAVLAVGHEVHLQV